MPEMPDVVSGETIESEWGNDIRDRTIQRYANVAGRTSLNASPTAGDLSYLGDTGGVDVYHSGGWKPVSQEIEVRGTNASGSLATSLTAAASVVFTPPAHWATYTVTAWGMLLATRNAAGADLTVWADVIIGADVGTLFNAVLVDESGSTPFMFVTVPANHRVGSLTGTLTVSLRGRRSTEGGTAAYQATINFIAQRNT